MRWRQASDLSSSSSSSCCSFIEHQSAEQRGGPQHSTCVDCMDSELITALSGFDISVSNNIKHPFTFYCKGLSFRFFFPLSSDRAGVTIVIISQVCILLLNNLILWGRCVLVDQYAWQLLYVFWIRYQIAPSKETCKIIERKTILHFKYRNFFKVIFFVFKGKETWKSIIW